MVKYILLIINLLILSLFSYKLSFAFDKDDLEKLLKDNECVNCDLSEADLRKKILTTYAAPLLNK